MIDYFLFPKQLQKYKSINIWINYCTVPNEKLHSGFDKVPINPNNLKFANVTDRQSCTDFDTAILNIDKEITLYYQPTRQNVKAKISGIGIVLEFAGLIGIDLDDIIDTTTGTINPTALKTVDFINSYTEFSVSGKGLHILVDGRLHTKEVNARGLSKGIKYKFDDFEMEMYDNSRYLTFSGNVFRDMPIQSKSDKANALYNRLLTLRESKRQPTAVHKQNQTVQQPVTDDDNALLQRMFKSKCGAEIKALFEGDISKCGSNSEADLKLCRHLAYWTGKDEERIDKLFRQSALYRTKWDREDYRTNTINLAIRLSGDRKEFSRYDKYKYAEEQRLSKLA